MAGAVPESAGKQEDARRDRCRQHQCRTHEPEPDPPVAAARRRRVRPSSDVRMIRRDRGGRVFRGRRLVAFPALSLIGEERSRQRAGERLQLGGHAAAES